jgi:hypothetical protein
MLDCGRKRRGKDMYGFAEDCSCFFDTKLYYPGIYGF